MRLPRFYPQDVVASLTGAIAAVPDGMAASVIVGVSPVHGLYASIVGPIAGGLTSRSGLMVVSTTGSAALAASDVIAGGSEDERMAALLLVTLLAGVFQVAATLLAWYGSPPSCRTR